MRLVSLRKVQRTHARKGRFARFVDTMRFGMAGSGTFGSSSLKLGSGLPSIFANQDMMMQSLHKSYESGKGKVRR
jgi:hypothetical protein